MSYIVTPETVVTLSDGKIFDLNDPIDKINWAWVRRHPYLSVDENEGKKSRDARFYVDNPVAKAEKRVKSAKIKDKVRYEIQYNMDRNKLLRAAKLLGDLGADAKSDLALQDSLLMLADVNPEMVDGAVFIKDTNMANAKMLFVEMMKYKLIQRGDGGVFRYGGEKGAPLGHTEELVIGFMLDEKNVDTLQMMKNSLAERKQVPVK